MLILFLFLPIRAWFYFSSFWRKRISPAATKKKGNFSKSQTKLDDDYFALSSIYSLNRYIYIEKIESKHFYISYAAVWVAFVYIFEQAVYTHKRSWVSRTTSRHYQQKENKSFRFSDTWSERIWSTPVTGRNFNWTNRPSQT